MSIRHIIKEVSPGVRTVKVINGSEPDIMENAFTLDTDRIFTEMLEALRQCRTELLSTYLMFGDEDNALRNSNGLVMANTVINKIDNHLFNKGK